MLSTMASSMCVDDALDMPKNKFEPPDLDYEGPSLHSRHEEMNGNEIPELVAHTSPTRNRRKRRKGIPTRIEPTVVHKDNDSSSDSDDLPPFLLPNSPARMPLKEPMGSDLSLSHSRNETPPLEMARAVSPAPQPLQLTEREPSPITVPHRKSSSGNRTPRSRRSSVNNKSHSKSAVVYKGGSDAESSEDVSGMVFGYTKVTSSIATTSRGAKRVKLLVYMCNFCNFKSTDNAAFWEHSVLHLFTCPHCPFKAFTRQSLVCHMEKDHPGQVPEEYINIREISVIDMRVTRNITSDPPPPGRGARLESPAFASPGGAEEGAASGTETPSRSANQRSQNQRSAQKAKIPDATPPQAHGGATPTDLKFRCDFCPYITSIFSAFMTHQKEHTTEVEKRTKTGAPSSGKLKSLLVGRSITPPPPSKPEVISPPKTAPAKTQVQKPPPQQAKTPASKPITPVLKVPQIPPKPGIVTTQEVPVPEASLSVDSVLQSELSKHAKCPICNFVLRSLSELEAHIHLCHQSRLTVSGSTTVDSCKNGSEDYTWCCIYCTAKSDTKMGVVTHIKANHPGEKIRVWRWANKPPGDGTAPLPGPEPSQVSPKKVATDSPAQPKGEGEDSSLILKQIVSSTIDNVYGSTFGDVQSSPLSLTKPVLSNQSLLKIPDVTNTSDIMEGKCAITVRKMTPTSNTQVRPMRSLITGGLVTSPGKPMSTSVTPVSTASPPPNVKHNSKNSTLESGNKGKGSLLSRNSEPMPELCLQPPLLTPSYLGILPDSSETQECSMDLSIKKHPRTEDVKSDSMKSEPMSPASDFSNDPESLFMKEDEDFSDLNNLDVDVEVKKESLIPTDHISYDEDQRLHCCRHCGYQTRSYGHIVDHISTHTGMKTWSCSYCSYRSNRRHDLLRHVQKTHPGSKLKMIRNVPYSSKFSYPLKMSQRVSAARAMVAKKRTTVKPGHKKIPQLSPGARSPSKSKSPSKVDKWQPPPTVEFWECPICTRRGSMDVMENHIPTVHPEKFRKRISKKEILEPSLDNLIMSANFSDRRNLKVDMIRLQNMPLANQDPKDIPLLNKLQEKLAQMPKILQNYNKVEGVDDALLGKELEEQRLVEMREEISWLSGLQNEQEDSDDESTITVRGKVGDEEYRCQYCTFSDQSLYVIRKHLIWNHPDLLLKCVDLRAKPPLSPRVVHMCHRCTFHSVSPVSLLSHYSRNPKHSPGNESDNNNSSSDDELPVLEPAGRDADASNDDSLPALERNQDQKVPGVKFLSRPLGKPSRNVALKRVTKSCKNSLRFMQGTQLQCRYCKDFKIHDSTIMKDHLLTEHSGQPAIAIDVRSRELRRTSRVFFCPILECRFTEYGPDALVKHLNGAHPDTAFDALIIQICPKDKSVDRNNSSKNASNSSKSAGTPSSTGRNSCTTSLSNSKAATPPPTRNSSTSASTRNSSAPTSNKNSTTPSTNKNSTSNSSNKKDNSKLDSKLPELESPKAPKSKSGSKKDKESKNSKKDKGKKAPVVEDDDGLLRGGTMPKISADLTLEKRYWCAYCDAHSACIDKVKAHFLQNHMEQKAQLIDARARVLRKKSRLFFCWNVTCSFTTFLENQFTLHEQSQACLNNFAPDEYETSKVESHSSGFSTPAGTPEYKPSSSGGSRMFQCLYCSLMTSSRVNMLSHMAAEHACTSGGYSEISTEFNNDGDIIMNVGGDAETSIAMVDD